MIREFEGKTEKEAIALAVKELGLEQDEFDVEIIHTEQTGFLFKKGNVKIRVHIEDGEDQDFEKRERLVPESEIEEHIIEFIETIISNMGYSCKAEIGFRKTEKLGITIESEDSAIIIGKKGKNLDALQLLANVYLGRISGDNDNRKLIIDLENYRSRREESLERLAFKTAKIVVQNKSSRLLEPMNPFERRLIHTALNDRDDVITKSEGEGLYKRVRVIYKG